MPTPEAQSTGGAVERELRRLAHLSILFAVTSLLATAGALTQLVNAWPLGEWIVATAGIVVAAASFVFGLMVSSGKTATRLTGFIVIAVVVPTTVLFALLTYVVSQSAWLFGLWTIVLLLYGALVTVMSNNSAWHLGPSDYAARW